jgi:hypothetical protein
MRRLILVGAVALAIGPPRGDRVLALSWAIEGPPAAQEATPPPAPLKVTLTDAAKERFLLEGEIVRRRSAPGGITNSQRATLRREDLEHDAHIQRIDEHKHQNQLGSGLEIDFHDSYKNNVAAYRLDRLLGLNMVPVTVLRRDDDGWASFTWWVEDVVMDEKARLKKKVRAPDTTAWNYQMYVVRVFDQLIYNFDRNLGNLLIDRDWRIWMIDHSRGFKIFKEVKTPENLGKRCARELLAGLRRLDHPTLDVAMKDLLSAGQVNGVLARRDWIVQYYDAKIAELGETAVLYDLPTQVTERAGPR